MIEFLQLPEERKRTFIAQTATETGITEKAVEKDWWVTLVLRAIFTLPMAEHFVEFGVRALKEPFADVYRPVEAERDSQRDPCRYNTVRSHCSAPEALHPSAGVNYDEMTIATLQIVPPAAKEHRQSCSAT